MGNKKKLKEFNSCPKIFNSNRKTTFFDLQLLKTFCFFFFDNVGILFDYCKTTKFAYNNTESNTHPVSTTKKSIMFQMFLRYDPLCKTKPKAKIFSEASTQNIPRK